jgi:hypothetical protein
MNGMAGGNLGQQAMKVTFKGVPGEQHESVYMYGHTFKKGEAVEVTDPMAQRKLANHPHFEADGEAPAVDDANLRAYVSTVMTAGQQALQRQATQQAQQNPPEPAPTPAQPPAPPALRSATEYQAMELSGRAPVVPKTAEQLRAELEQAEQTEKENADANADAQRAGDSDSAQAARAGSAGSGHAGRSGKGR